MTGHGHGSYASDGISLAVEIRTVNSRYVKINVRCGEVYQTLEPQIEELVRKKIRRGTIQVNVKIDRKSDVGSYSVNEAVLNSYVQAIQKMNSDRVVATENLLSLPGVIEESTDRKHLVETDWPVIKSTILTALEHLSEMRKAEGESMMIDLQKNCDLIEKYLGNVEEQAPQVAQQYQTRLVEKLNQMLNESGAEFEPRDVIKEVGVLLTGVTYPKRLYD